MSTPTQIEHLVLLKLKPNLDPSDLASLRTAVQQLGNHPDIPGIICVSCGETFCLNAEGEDSLEPSDNRSNGYNFSLRVTLKDKNCLKIYAANSYHLLIKADIIAPLLDKTQPGPLVIATDYEYVKSEATYMEYGKLVKGVVCAAGISFVMGLGLLLRKRK